MFTPDASPEKLKYTITIDVYENCSKFNIFAVKGNTDSIFYHEIIGVLEVTKTMYIRDISENNRKLLKKKKQL